MYDRKKICSAQNVTDVSFFCSDAYLDEKEIYPVIISANLSEHEEERLLKTLKKHRAAIGYTLDDLKGISHSMSTQNKFGERRQTIY